MQIKTIQKNIQNKMDEWLKTITNESLRKEVRKNLLVSGGSITSMFLNIEINDYDVYIKDMDALLQLTKYYADFFPNEIEVYDGRDKINYLDEFTKNYHLENSVDINEVNSSRAIALRTLHADQIKLFFPSEKGFLRVNEDKAKDVLNYTPLFFTANAISLSDNVQIVMRFHGDAQAIHKTFDFIHATNYFTFDEGLVCNNAALISILTKQLKYQGSYYPLTSIIRMKKFIKRGWNINAGEILKIIFQISELNLKNPDVLEEQLIGVDVAYFGTLIGILRGVPVDKMCSEYLNAIIDKVFNNAEEED